MKPIDEFALRQIKKGNIEAFQELAISYQSKIFALCFRMLQNREDATDASQETLLKIYRNIVHFQEKSSLSTWIYSITKNVCLDMLRKQKKEFTTVHYDYLIEMHLPPQKDPADEIAQKTAMECVIKTIRSLPKDQAEILILRDFDGYSYQEIAEILNISVGTVKSRLFRGRLKLQQELRRQDLL